MRVLMTCLLRNRALEAQRGLASSRWNWLVVIASEPSLVDLLEDGRVVWHGTDNAVSWWHGDGLTLTTTPEGQGNGLTLTTTPEGQE